MAKKDIDSSKLPSIKPKYNKTKKRKARKPRFRHDKLKLTYEKAIKMAGQEPLKNYKAQWRDIRQEIKAQGKTPPTVYEYARAYDSTLEDTQTPESANVPTIDFGREVIEDFVSHLQRIYQDTLDYIDNNKEGGHEEGKLASIASFKIDIISRMYHECLDTLKRLIQDYGTTIVGQAIKDNVELDYTIAISLYPPSDVVVEFEETLSQLLALESQMAQRASELAQQAEDEYYGV